MFELTLTSLPPHGFWSCLQVISIYSFWAINVKRFKNFYINVITMQLINHVVISIWTLRLNKIDVATWVVRHILVRALHLLLVGSEIILHVCSLLIVLLLILFVLLDLLLLLLNFKIFFFILLLLFLDFRWWFLLLFFQLLSRLVFFLLILFGIFLCFKQVALSSAPTLKKLKCRF